MEVITAQQNFESSNTDHFSEQMNKFPGVTDISEKPWHVEFQWKNMKSRITLESGEDLIKISMLLSELLSANGIKNKLDISSEIL